MIETSNSFYAASNLCHTSSTVWARKKWQDSLTATYDQIFSIGDRCEDRAGHGRNEIPCSSKKVRWQLTKYGLALSCQKMEFGRPVRQSATTGRKMWEMYQFEFNLKSIRTKDVNVVYPMVEQTSRCKVPMQAVMCGLLQASRHAYSHWNSAYKTEIRLKRRHWVISLSSFIVERTRVTVSLCDALSREVEVMAA